MKMTKAILKAGLSVRGAYGGKQLAVLGIIEGKNKRKGWQDRLIGKDFTSATIERFLKMKDSHISPKKLAKYKSLKKKDGNKSTPTKWSTVEPKKRTIDDVFVYTDGGCSGDYRGAWAFAIDSKEYESGFIENTTNNRAEMMAILHAVTYCTEYYPGKAIHILSDSEYCVKGFNSWMRGWRKRGWKRRTTKPGDDGDVKNLDLWKKFWELRSKRVSLVWVKGHSGNKMNELCDSLCTQEINNN